MTGDVQPLGEYPEVDNWLGVIQENNNLRDMAIGINRQLTAALKRVEELLRENVALTAQLDYARGKGTA